MPSSASTTGSASRITGWMASTATTCGTALAAGWKRARRADTSSRPAAGWRSTAIGAACCIRLLPVPPTADDKEQHMIRRILPCLLMGLLSVSHAQATESDERLCKMYRERLQKYQKEGVMG